MKKVFLHIGSPKTGTTSLQSTLFNNREVLLQQGIMYPGDEICHHKLYFLFNQDRKFWPRMFNGVPKQKLKESVDRYFKTVSHDLGKNFEYFLVSTESFFRSDDDAIRNLADFFLSIADEIEVIVFVRRPSEHYASSQQQIIKASSQPRSPLEYYYDFKNVISTWSKYAKIHVLEFDKSKDSLLSLSEVVGIDTGSFKAVPRENESLSIEKMLLLEKIQYHVYPHGDDVFKNHLGVVSKIASGEMTIPELRSEVAAFIDDNHKDDIQWLKKNHGINFNLPEVDCNVKHDIGKRCSIEDIYYVDYNKFKKFESHVMDFLLRNLLRTG